MVDVNYGLQQAWTSDTTSKYYKVLPLLLDPAHEIYNCQNFACICISTTNNLNTVTLTAMLGERR